MKSISLIVLLLMHFAIIDGHPQCLDFTFPFTPSNPMVLCKEYSAFGCCSQQADLKIVREFLNIYFRMGTQERFNCSTYLQTLLCQKCSPYAAHIYDAELLPIAKSFPGLCPSFCNTMLTTCSSIIRYLTNDTTLLSLIDQKNFAAFCNSVTTIDKDYCYPDLKQNPDLSQNLGRVDFYQSATDCIAICLEEIDSNRPNPLSMKHARDGTHRLFVAEQLGLVWIYLPDHTRLYPPFLDLRNVVVSNKLRYDERGMLDIEFHPNYRQNGLFYLYYSFAISGQDYVKISEMKVSDNDMNRANVSSERTLLQILQPVANHNGGKLLFKMDGIDNNLYIFTGDGGAGGDPFGAYGNGQNKKTMLGKVLRIDVNSRGISGRPYGIPPDNPFVNDARYLPEIYALGVRNMWRCSSDRGDKTGFNKGRIICGDVGQNRFEEIDIIVKGGNYGWRAYEGNFCFDPAICNSNFVKNYIPPIHAYSHAVGKSVIGGHVYRGCQNPNLRGLYIFGDYHNGKMFALTEHTSGAWTSKPICMARPDVCVGKLQNFYAKNILSFGESENGELYVLSTASPQPASPRGSIYKIVDPSRGVDPTECEKYMRNTILSPGTQTISHQKKEAAGLLTVFVRLVSFQGYNDRGRVEVLYDSVWGTICDDQWDIQDAGVVCRMLGFRYAIAAPVRARYGSGVGKVWLSKVACLGNENNLAQCRHGGWGNTVCGHFRDASVICGQ